MKPRIQTFVPLDYVTSSFLNQLQDDAAAVVDFHGRLIGGEIWISRNGNEVNTTPIALLTMHGESVSGSAYASPPTAINALVADTWYHVYARISAGSIVYTLSTLPPDANLVLQDGDDDYRYLGSFVTYDDGGTTRALPVRQTNGLFLYEEPGTELAGFFSKLAIGIHTNASAPATVATNHDLYPLFVPDFAKGSALIRARVELAAATPIADYVFRFRSRGMASNTGKTFFRTYPAGVNFDTFEAEVDIGNSNSGLGFTSGFTFESNTATQPCQVYLHCDGYRLPNTRG